MSLRFLATFRNSLLELQRFNGDLMLASVIEPAKEFYTVEKSSQRMLLPTWELVDLDSVGSSPGTDHTS